MSMPFIVGDRVRCVHGGEVLTVAACGTDISLDAYPLPMRPRCIVGELLVSFQEKFPSGLPVVPMRAVDLVKV